MNWKYSSYPNRTICDVLKEMRACCKTLNFSSLIGLIEEAQSMGNRMEAALEDKRDVKTFQEERSKLIKELKELDKKITAAKEQLPNEGEGNESI